MDILATKTKKWTMTQMKEHKNTDNCKQETRISLIENRLDTKQKNIQKLQEGIKKVETETHCRMEKLDETLDKLNIVVTSLETTINNFKWGFTALMVLLGGIITFLVTKLIEMI